MRPLAIAMLFAAACGAKPAPSTSTPTPTEETTSTPESTPPADDMGNACYSECMARMPDAMNCNGECGAFDEVDADAAARDDYDDCIDGCMSAGDDQETCEAECNGG
jgi:hypothetical protein